MMKILSGLAFISAVLMIVFDYTNRQMVWVFKPLTMIAIIAMAQIYGAKNSYKFLILVGLIFSLAGDVFLINPQKYFVYGLTSFLIAHIFYTAAFIKASAGKFRKDSLAALGFGALMIALIYGDVSENLKIPVMIYAAAISLMLGAAVNFYFSAKSPKACLAISGAILFVISDSFLAINKFTYEFFLAKFAILATYFAAQWLIARSVSE